MHWLTLPPSSWDQFVTYNHLRGFLQDIQVVNDPAERAVKDVQEYAHMDRAPGDRDNLILVATDHHGHVANLHKPNLNRVWSEFTWTMQLEISLLFKDHIIVKPKELDYWFHLVQYECCMGSYQWYCRSSQLFFTFVHVQCPCIFFTALQMTPEIQFIGIFGMKMEF